MKTDIALPERRSLPFSLRHVTATVHLTDAILIILTSMVSGAAYRFLTSDVPGELDQFAATGTLVAVLVVGLDVAGGLCRPEALLHPGRQIRQVFLAWSFALFVVLGLAFAWHATSIFSRGALSTFFAAGAGLMVVDRLLWSSILQEAMKQERLKVRRIAVVYAAEADRAVIEAELANLRRNGFRPLWQVAVPTCGPAADENVALQAMLRGTNVEEIFILSDWTSVPRLVVSEELARLPIPVRYLPIGTGRLICEGPREKLGDRVSFEIQRGALSGGERFVKAAFDRIVAAIALALLVPIFGVIAIAIKGESAGPIFFRQARRGFNGRPFDIWKFRTMRVLENDGSVRQATVGDPRVTRVGRWLRRASVDELPQLINVLRGEMSIVGPRPHAVSHDDHYDRLIADYPRRQNVLPGLTGWAQVKGARGETPTVDHMRRRVELDLWYVQHWSFRRDLMILSRTCWHLFASRDAY